MAERLKRLLNDYPRWFAAVQTIKTGGAWRSRFFAIARQVRISTLPFRVGSRSAQEWISPSRCSSCTLTISGSICTYLQITSGISLRNCGR